MLQSCNIFFKFSDELAHHLKDSGASYIYTIGELLPTVKEAVKDVSNIKVYNLLIICTLSDDIHKCE